MFISPLLHPFAKYELAWQNLSYSSMATSLHDDKSTNPVHVRFFLPRTLQIIIIFCQALCLMNIYNVQWQRWRDFTQNNGKSVLEC